MTSGIELLSKLFRQRDLSMREKMKPLIVVSSKTGNTRIIARALQDGIGECDYVEACCMPEDLSSYNPIVLCFWCDRGMAPEDIQAAAVRIEGKDIACVATMGGDPGTDKAKDWMERTSRLLTEVGKGNRLKLQFLCRGRIDPELFARMTAMMGGEVTPEREKRRRESETHPDRLDALAVVKAYRDVFEV